MNTSLIFSNLLNPPVLFFFLGTMAVWLRSDLDVPQPLPKFFALYLLLSLGFKGGVELNKSGINPQIALTLLAAIAMALAVPLYTFFVLRRKMPVPDAAAIAATYGSISAVTFITATAFLGDIGQKFGGHMVAAMALMESPAVVVGVLLARLAKTPSTATSTTHRVLDKTSNETTANASSAADVETNDIATNEAVPDATPCNFNGEVARSSVSSVRANINADLLRDAFLNGSVFLLLGSLVIGILTGAKGGAALKPFTDDIFKGVLSLFLLDMGMVSARRLAGSQKLGVFPIVFALLVPLLNAALGIGIARALHLATGDALLFCVLCASASYIAVPAALRMAIPEANPGIYVSMALALTFPFNVVLGIPLYMTVINTLWR